MLQYFFLHLGECDRYGKEEEMEAIAMLVNCERFSQGRVHVYNERHWTGSRSSDGGKTIDLSYLFAVQEWNEGLDLGRCQFISSRMQPSYRNYTDEVLFGSVPAEFLYRGEISESHYAEVGA